MSGPDPGINGLSCSDCLHLWSEHSLEVGCRAGWEYKDGVAVTDGCECALAHVRLSNHDG